MVTPMKPKLPPNNPAEQDLKDEIAKLTQEVKQNEISLRRLQRLFLIILLVLNLTIWAFVLFVFNEQVALNFFAICGMVTGVFGFIWTLWQIWSSSD